MANVALAQLMFDRTALVTGLDDAICTMHFWSSGNWDTPKRSGTTGDIKTFWNGVSNVATPKHVLREVRWYDVPDTAPYHAVYQETQVITPPPGIAGTGGGVNMPPQNAMTVTLKTASRKHWGRFYLPCDASASMDASTQLGAFKSSVCDSVAAAGQTLAQVADSTTHGKLVVWAPSLGTFEAIAFVQVDNVPDIQRRRRVKKATYKKTLAV